MSAQATNAAIRGDIEALHDLGSALLPHARKGLQQVNNLDVSEYIILGSLVQGLGQRQVPGANPRLELSSDSPGPCRCFTSSRKLFR